MIFLQALLGLVVYDVLDLVCPFVTICAIVRRWKTSRNRADQNIVNRTCAALNWACIWYPKRALCLQRSFVTTYLLRRHGIPAQMVLGAQKLPFKAHAWVEVDGHAINERSNVKVAFGVWEKC